MIYLGGLRETQIGDEPYLSGRLIVKWYRKEISKV